MITLEQSAAQTLSRPELAYIADFLDGAVDEFSEMSCDEYAVPATPANLAALSPVIAWKIAAFGDQWNDAKTPAAYFATFTTRHGDYIVPHEWAAAFFASRYRGATLDAIPAAEALIVAGVLEASAEMHAQWLEDDPDTEIEAFTLPPTDAAKAFMAALLVYLGKKARAKKVLDATEPISVPDHWAMRYLAHRCKQAAIAGDSVQIAAVEVPPSASDAHSVPHIERADVAPRFPDVKKYLARYFVNFPNWQAQDLQFLARYAAEGPGFSVREISVDSYHAYTNDRASRSVEICARKLRWHAVQVALGAKVPKRQVSKGLAACIKRVAALRVNAPHIYTRVDEPAKKDFNIAQYLLYAEAFTPAEVEQALLAGVKAAYAADITRRAASNADTQYWIQLRAEAQDGLEAYRREIGGDWTIPWRRSVAYQYRAIQMSDRTPGRMLSTLQDYVPALVHCMLLGWQDWALDLWQRAHDRVTRGWPDLSAKKHGTGRRTQLFVLRLLDQWLDKPRDAYPPQAYDDPVFAALLVHWRHPDPAAMVPLLLAACDRRTHAAFAKGSFEEMDDDAYWYDPYEILLILHLRRALGLDNPVLDHPVMQTPLGVLPAPVAPFQETLLDGVMARFDKEFAGQAVPEKKPIRSSV